MSSTSSMFLSMLAGQAPLLVVYLGAAVLAITLWSRHPRPALFVMLGSVVLLLTTLAWPAVQSWVMTSRTAGGLSTAQVGQRVAILSLLMSVVRAGAYVLLVCAAFVGRRSEDVQPGFPV